MAENKIDLPMVAVAGNLIFSKKEVQACYVLPQLPYDFLSDTSKIALGNGIINAYTALVGDKETPLDCKIYCDSFPVDVRAWEMQVREATKTWDKTPGFEDYIQDQVSMLLDQEYVERKTFLFISLGRRGQFDYSNLNVFELGVKGSMDKLKEWVSKALVLPGDTIDADEERYYRDKEMEIFRVLNAGNLQAVRATSEEILLLTKRQFYPGMPSPYLDVDYDTRLGAGDIIRETSGVVEKNYYYLKFIQQIGEYEIEGYRACLTFSRFPKNMVFPYGAFPFFYFPSKLGLPFPCWADFTLHPSAKMKKELEKKKKEQKDEIENMAVSQTGVDAIVNPNVEVSESLADIQHMSEILANDKTPWVEGSYYIVVETPTLELLKKYCSRVKQSFKDQDIDIWWSPGNQRDLFIQQMAGSSRVKGPREQLTNMGMIPMAGANFNSKVGDEIKPYTHS